jgi:zinc and cadmium transporter
MTVLALFIASLFIMLASLSGVIFIHKRFANWTERNLNYLVAFALGVFGVVAYDLIFEALEFASSGLIVLAFFIIGFLLFFLLEKLFPEMHCHHGEHEGETRRSLRKVLWGDALHNIGDGILLAPVFVSDIRLGFVAAFGIFVHEFVQEISEFFVLRKAGYSVKGALVLNFAVSSTILIGAFGGLYVSSFESFVAPLIALAAGAFVHILVIDLIPESVKHSHREQKYLNYFAWVLLGILLIVLLNHSVIGH